MSNMEKVNANDFEKDPNRYIIVSGTNQDAPTCPYGNTFKWVGYDLKEEKYIRFTKSVFLKLVKEKESIIKTKKLC